MAESYAILMTNASRPDPESETPTHFGRVARALGDLLLVPYR